MYRWHNCYFCVSPNKANTVVFLVSNMSVNDTKQEGERKDRRQEEVRTDKNTTSNYWVLHMEFSWRCLDSIQFVLWSWSANTDQHNRRAPLHYNKDILNTCKNNNNNNETTWCMYTQTAQGKYIQLDALHIHLCVQSMTLMWNSGGSVGHVRDCRSSTATDYS